MSAILAETGRFDRRWNAAIPNDLSFRTLSLGSSSQKADGSSHPSGHQPVALLAGSAIASVELLAPREWARTIDRTGNNRLLYQLSYRGTQLHLGEFSL